MIPDSAGHDTCYCDLARPFGCSF